MKKIIAILLVLGLMLTLCACGTSSEVKPNTNDNTQSSQDTSSNEKEDSKFTITLVDQNGDPVPNATVQVCSDVCFAMITDANGVAKFNFEYTDGHKVVLHTCPEGYETEYVGENYLYLEDGETEFTFEITKK